MNVLKTTLQGDGIRGLYRGFFLSYVGVIVYRGSYFGFYDLMKLYTGDVNLVIKFMIGYLTTIVAGTITYPIDTIRKRMMMRSL
jgi:solute carrier family 25 (mitochondrial adenine nucleotide translocator), member 4/5/6/31